MVLKALLDSTEPFASEQLETLPAPDGYRRITHLLVDAGACDFTWVDPLPKDIIAGLVLTNCALLFSPRENALAGGEATGVALGVCPSGQGLRSIP